MSKIAVGLDIGKACVKLVSLAFDGSKVELLDFESAEFADFPKPFEVSDAIRKILQKKKINPRLGVCLSLPSEDSFFKIQKITNQERGHFKKVIYDELRNNVAFSFDDCIWDY